MSECDILDSGFYDEFRQMYNFLIYNKNCYLIIWIQIPTEPNIPTEQVLGYIDILTQTILDL